MDNFFAILFYSILFLFMLSGTISGIRLIAYLFAIELKGEVIDTTVSYSILATASIFENGERYTPTVKVTEDGIYKGTYKLHSIRRQSNYQKGDTVKVLKIPFGRTYFIRAKQTFLFQPILAFIIFSLLYVTALIKIKEFI